MWACVRMPPGVPSPHSVTLPLHDAGDRPTTHLAVPARLQRASCGSYPELERFLSAANPPLSDAFASEDYVHGVAYKDTDGYQCVLSTVKAIVESWTPRCQGDSCKTAVQDLGADKVPPYVDYSAGAAQQKGAAGLGLPDGLQKVWARPLLCMAGGTVL